MRKVIESVKFCIFVWGLVLCSLAVGTAVVYAGWNAYFVFHTQAMQIGLGTALLITIGIYVLILLTSDFSGIRQTFEKNQALLPEKEYDGYIVFPDRGKKKAKKAKKPANKKAKHRKKS